MRGFRGRIFVSMVAALPLWYGIISSNVDAQVQVPAVDPSGVIGATRRQPAGPPEATPRLKDGTVNLGRVHGEKGIWGLPVIANFAQVAGGFRKTFKATCASARLPSHTFHSSHGQPLCTTTTRRISRNSTPKDIVLRRRVGRDLWRLLFQWR